MPEYKNTRIINDLLFVLYLAFFASLIFAFRSISSISVAFLLAAGIVKNRISHKSFFDRSQLIPMITFCSLLLLLQFVSLLYTDDMEQGWKNIRLKAALVIIPLSICCCNYIDETTRSKLLKWYCAILVAACFYAL